MAWPVAGGRGFAMGPSRDETDRMFSGPWYLWQILFYFHDLKQLGINPTKTNGWDLDSFGIDHHCHPS